MAEPTQRQKPAIDLLVDIFNQAIKTREGFTPKVMREFERLGSEAKIAREQEAGRSQLQEMIVRRSVEPQVARPLRQIVPTVPIERPVLQACVALVQRLDGDCNLVRWSAEGGVA